MKKKIKYLIIICVIILIVLLILVNKGKTDIEENVEEYIQEKPEERYTKKKEKYECNEFEFISVNTEQLVRIYFNKFKNTVLNDTSNGYKMLDEEYREKRFGSLSAFENYVQNNKEKLGSMTLAKYNVNNYQDYTQYVCVDSENNYYIINSESIMNFEVFLDIYTIDTPQFIKEYEESNTQERVALNIDKIIESLNNKDYNYMYSHLSEDFKKNRYSTLSDFTSYMQGICYDEMDVEYNEFTNEGEIYIYNINLIDSTGNNPEKIEMQIIMKLEERDFILSFSL